MGTKPRSEEFERFVTIKEEGLNDLQTMVQQCHDKVSFLSYFFVPPCEFEGDAVSPDALAGIGYFLTEIVEDLNLISAEMSYGPEESDGKNDVATRRITPEKIEKVEEKGKEAG